MAMLPRITAKPFVKFYAVILAFTTIVILTLLSNVHQPAIKPTSSRSVTDVGREAYYARGMLVKTGGELSLHVDRFHPNSVVAIMMDVTVLGKTLGKPAIIHSSRRYQPEHDSRIDGWSKPLPVEEMITHKGTIVKLPRRPRDEYQQKNIKMLKKREEALTCLFNQTYKRKITDRCLVKMLNNPNNVCPDSVRIGHPFHDGGWAACLTDPFGFTPPCIVFSFGIGYDWKFDDDMAVYYNCTVYSFDPTMTAKTHDRRENLHFYDVGIGGLDKKRNRRGWRVMTFKSILQMLDLTNATIDMVKMDIESDEFRALPTMLEDGSMRNVKQIAMEVHLGEPKLRLFELLETGYFAHYDTKVNALTREMFGGVPHNCYEVYYYNKLFF